MNDEKVGADPGGGGGGIIIGGAVAILSDPVISAQIPVAKRDAVNEAISRYPHAFTQADRVLIGGVIGWMICNGH